ncbi:MULTISPECIES: hypothetical protein [unclassified Neisseria]|uniref:hypothetical protein n=1 Tax=unclassified Neisseria TaxID=2623750 RepID=UPI00107297C7|nr:MULTISPECIES: hypothetical protein [unclassified Neisseria]MBF0803267.1 hypothetical protein [Neisseria sp. 19428wB4_WF04]TFU44106.1 hypothetical protein E4T99_02665 [Neisseria sp. WF04]
MRPSETAGRVCESGKTVFRRPETLSITIKHEPKQMKHPAAALLGMLFCLPCAAVWAQTPQAGFIGVYSHHSVDSVASLAILPDHTFCLSSIAGAMDIHSPGKWEQSGKDRNSIRLKFTRTSRFPSRFVVYAGKPDHSTGKKTLKPELRINTAAFSALQRDVVFGSSNSPQTPANMAPFFSPQQNGFSAHETLPLKHRYLFFGYPRREGGWQITRFDIGKPRGHVWINMSEEAMQDQQSWEGRFQNGKLLMIGSEMYGNHTSMGKPDPLSAKEVNEIRKHCTGLEHPPGLTLIRPQAEYPANSLPDKPALFGRDEDYGEAAHAPEAVFHIE